mmetsp:Transcript_23792/g.68075  ORF Transcript_23792/g.68075 Transcript_23792/m.68075 type:complete len:429 (+) Transcript_23792:236-1522(+)
MDAVALCHAQGRDIRTAPAALIVGGNPLGAGRPRLCRVADGSCLPQDSDLQAHGAGAAAARALPAGPGGVPAARPGARRGGAALQGHQAGPAAAGGLERPRRGLLEPARRRTGEAVLRAGARALRHERRLAAEPLHGSAGHGRRRSGAPVGELHERAGQGQGGRRARPPGSAQLGDARERVRRRLLRERQAARRDQPGPDRLREGGGRLRAQGEAEPHPGLQPRHGREVRRGLPARPLLLRPGARPGRAGRGRGGPAGVRARPPARRPRGEGPRPQGQAPAGAHGGAPRPGRGRPDPRGAARGRARGGAAGGHGGVGRGPQGRGAGHPRLLRLRGGLLRALHLQRRAAEGGRGRDSHAQRPPGAQGQVPRGLRRGPERPEVELPQRHGVPSIRGGPPRRRDSRRGGGAVHGVLDRRGSNDPGRSEARR